MAGALRLTITSPPEREDFVVEIWDDQTYIVAVQPDGEAVVFEYMGGDGRLHEVELSAFVDALGRARDNLR